MRYYYDDPLAAAWMAKRHSMKLELVMFDVDTKETVRHQLGDVLEWPRLNIDTERFGLRYYIHPDSLHLLKPQVGELVTVNDGQDAHIAFHQDYIDALEANYGSFVHPVRIIQRNGLAFMWPKEET